MAIFKIIVTAMGLIMSLGYFPQAYKIYKNKNAADISLPAFIIFAVGTLTWTIYGFALHDWPLIFSFAVGVFGSWSVLILTLRYKK